MVRLPRTSPQTFDAVAREFAVRQHGLATRGQLVSGGVDAAIIDRRIRAGSLRVMHRGVYLVGPLETPLARELAATLACGPGAVLWGRSAAHVWQLTPAEERPQTAQVAIRDGHRRSRPGIDVRRIASLEARDLTRLQDIPVTTAVRTLFDLAAGGAGKVRRALLEKAMAEAIARGLATMADLRDMARRQAGRAGVGRFRAVLQVETDGLAFTRSKAEDVFLDLVRRAGIPTPKVNVRVGGHEVDFYWPDRRLAVEVDGRAFHVSPRSFERDRLRDAELDAAGIRVVRVTWRQLTSDREGMLFRLGRSFAVGGEPGVE